MKSLGTSTTRGYFVFSQRYCSIGGGRIFDPHQDDGTMDGSNRSSESNNPLDANAFFRQAKMKSGTAGERWRET